MKLVIKGAFYFDRKNETILIPHYTGEYFAVDCDSFEKLDALKDRYDENYINNVIDNPIEFEGEKYYSTEYSPYNVGDWELLSDLSELSHLEEDYNF